MKIIGLCGYAQSGKDAAAQALTDIGWTRVSFADPLRKALLALDPLVPYCTDGTVILEHPPERLSSQITVYGWDYVKKYNPEVRRLLQRLGTEAGRDIHGEFCWTRIAGVSIDSAIADGTAGIVVTDCRFENEVRCLRKRSSWGHPEVKIVRVTRPGVGPINGHISDTAIDKLPCDATIVNDGTLEQLREKILAIAMEKPIVTA